MRINNLKLQKLNILRQINLENEVYLDYDSFGISIKNGRES